MAGKSEELQLSRIQIVSCKLHASLLDENKIRLPTACISRDVGKNFGGAGSPNA
jgi:hypothetical protein